MNGQWISEHAFRICERNSVLSQIAGSFGRIKLKLH